MFDVWPNSADETSFSDFHWGRRVTAFNQTMLKHTSSTYTIVAGAGAAINRVFNTTDD